ncbi:transposase [Hydrogenimonas sp.]
MITRCIHCNHPRLYTLANGYLKCAACKRKISPAKIERAEHLIDAFCRNLTAREAAKACGYSYMTAKTHYDRIRVLLTQYLEERYNEYAGDIKEFDEYFYLEQNKKKSEETIFDIQNFLTFDYGGKIYNILMPSLRKYRTNLLDDGLQHEYYNQLSRFITFRRIARLEHLNNTIVKFWHFFETHIKRYRGVNEKHFFYYLKEAEFKFNYTKHEQKEILLSL